MIANGGSTVVVTGGTRGLGYELSLEFARQGHRVLALYHADEEAAARLDRVCSAESLPCRSLKQDVAGDTVETGIADAPEIAAAASLTLIHNASASFEPTPLHLLEWCDFARSLDVALKGGVQCTRALLRPMLRLRAGTVVAVLTNALSPVPPKGFASYLAAKAAVRALMCSLAVEYGARGLRVLTVSPGFMQTSLTAGWHPELARLVADATGPVDPATVARRIRALVEDRSLPCSGENYDV